jgi:hypothetical protein
LLALNLAARTLSPLSLPSRPNATVAGFFSGVTSLEGFVTRFPLALPEIGPKLYHYPPLQQFRK